MPHLADPELLKRIPLTASIVLQVGCTTGELAAAYRRTNPKVRLLATADAATVPALESHFDAVVARGDGDDPPFAGMAGQVDCIIYDHCLERAPDPIAIVQRHATLLSHDGMMLIKASNPDHWRRTDRMLRGAAAEDLETEDPPPSPSLAMDRFGTALQEAGLSLCDVTADDTGDDDATAYFAALSPALASLGVDEAEYKSRAMPAHLIWRVRRTQGARLIVAGSMLEPVGGVSHVRVLHPLAAIGSDPLATVSVIDQLQARPPQDDTPRIFVLHRPALVAEHGGALLRALRISGYLVVTEFDDHPDYFRMMRQGGDLSFRGVHALQTSTPALANVLRQYNPEIAVFPNAIDRLPDVHNFNDLDSMTLFFGALNREDCWQPLMDVINTVARMAGTRLSFQVVHDRKFFDALQTPHKAFTPTCDYDTYLQILGASEICFMPLSDTPFNRAKSDLKFVECGACRVATVASSVVYGDSIQHNETGFLFRDPTELYNALLRLLAVPESARAMGDAARRYVTDKRMLAYQVAPRISWYRTLWQRRPILEAALSARMAQFTPAA
jgi:SAM-dependent methyltransferase